MISNNKIRKQYYKTSSRGLVDNSKALVLNKVNLKIIVEPSRLFIDIIREIMRGIWTV